VVSPLMVLAIGGSNGLAVIAPIMIFAGIQSAWQHRREVEKTILGPLIYSAILGTAAGGLILWGLVSSGAEAAIHYRLEVVVGGLSIAYMVLIALREKLARHGPNRPPRNWEICGAGALVSICQTVANSGTPLLTTFFVFFKTPKERFVAAQAYFLLVQNTAKLVPFVLLGILHPGNFGTSLLLLPLVYFGGWSGARMSRHWSEVTFFRLYLVALVIGFVASVLLIVGRTTVLGWL